MNNVDLDIEGKIIDKVIMARVSSIVGTSDQKSTTPPLCELSGYLATIVESSRDVVHPLRSLPAF